MTATGSVAGGATACFISLSSWPSVIVEASFPAVLCGCVTLCVVTGVPCWLGIVRLTFEGGSRLGIHVVRCVRAIVHAMQLLEPHGELLNQGLESLHFSMEHIFAVAFQAGQSHVDVSQLFTQFAREGPSSVAEATSENGVSSTKTHLPHSSHWISGCSSVLLRRVGALRVMSAVSRRWAGWLSLVNRR
ncbi:hypothetical protein MTO96_051940 [Rhipicephalus appendiculatus]